MINVTPLGFGNSVVYDIQRCFHAMKIASSVSMRHMKIEMSVKVLLIRLEAYLSPLVRLCWEMPCEVTKKARFLTPA